MAFRLEIDPALRPCPTRPALIWARDICAPSFDGPLPDFLADLVKRAAAGGEDFWPPEVKARVRKMLRFGKYKPAGRGKPASEFLLQAAAKGSFPNVCGPVDVNNAISLESGLPGTIFDSALSGEHLLLRRGGPAEEYVFNPSGQTISLADLLLVCRRTEGGWEPCGNPVKDAMATKISAATRSVVAVLYAPVDLSVAEVRSWAERFAELLRTHCAASEVGAEVIEP